MKTPGPGPDPRQKLFDLTALIACGLLVMAVFLAFELRLTGMLNGVPLDDSWIHYRFAQNLQNGEGFSFNPGRPTPGSTAPLWVIVLSILGGGFLIPSKILGILAYLACGALVYLLAFRVTASRASALLAGLGTLFAGRLAWIAPSGMETTAFTAFSLLVLVSWGSSRRGRISPWTSLAFGLACLLRPEGYLLVLLSVLDRLLHLRGTAREGIAERLGQVFRHLTIAGLVVVPYVFFSWATAGHILPNTFYAKSAIWGCQSGIRYFQWIGSLFLLDNPLLAVLAIPGLVCAALRMRWRSEPAIRLGAGWLLLLPFFYGVLAPCVSGYYTRYTTPLIPVMMLFAVLGGLELENRLRAWLESKDRSRWNPEAAVRLWRLVMVEGALLALVPTLSFWAPYYARGVADIEEMHLKTGRWLSEHSQAGEVLALNDIGAIGSMADREVIDLMGLTSPEILSLISGKGPGAWDVALAEYLSIRQPDYLVIFPNWFPGLASRLPARPVYKVQLPVREIAGMPGITVAGGGEMVVFRLDWDGAR
jgi:hypothetical protein